MRRGENKEEEAEEEEDQSICCLPMKLIKKCCFPIKLSKQPPFENPLRTSTTYAYNSFKY